MIFRLVRSIARQLIAEQSVRGALFKNGVPAPQVDVSEFEVLAAFITTLMIVVVGEGVDLLSEVARQDVVFQQDAVFQGLGPSSLARQPLPAAMRGILPRI